MAVLEASDLGVPTSKAAISNNLENLQSPGEAGL
jgi:hypothetical protein